jgi:hypothetical protein
VHHVELCFANPSDLHSVSFGRWAPSMLPDNIIKPKKLTKFQDSIVCQTIHSEFAGTIILNHALPNHPPPVHLFHQQASNFSYTAHRSATVTALTSPKAQLQLSFVSVTAPHRWTPTYAAAKTSAWTGTIRYVLPIPSLGTLSHSVVATPLLLLREALELIGIEILHLVYYSR